MAIVDFTPTTSAAVAIAVVLLSILYYIIKNRNVPPGPRGLPYLGLYPELKDETVHLQLREYGEKYGDLFSFTFTGKLMINLGSVKATREVHINKSDCFAGRYTDFSILSSLMSDGVAFANGEQWKVLRKFFVQTYKEYGLTIIRDNAASPIYDSVSQAVEDIRAKKGEPFNVIELLTEKCMGSIRRALFGEDGVTDEDLREMVRAYGVTLDAMTGVKMMLMGPVGSFIFKSNPHLRKAIAEHWVMNALLRKTIKKIESSMDENHTTCIVEDFFRERSTRKGKNDPTWEYFSDKGLVESLSQMVGDGILAVAYFVAIFFHGIIEHPEEQDKIYKELTEVVGTERLPSVEDKSKLQYTNAFINEVTRTSYFFALFPSLECTKETTVRGYRIPKGSITLLNAWQANHDPATYENPFKFDPSRYLVTPDKPRAELPSLFGMGKRACIGEVFAMTQAFMFLTSIVKNFKIAEPENPKIKSDLFLMTGNMELCFTPRTEN